MWTSLGAKPVAGADRIVVREVGVRELPIPVTLKLADHHSICQDLDHRVVHTLYRTIAIWVVGAGGNLTSKMFYVGFLSPTTRPLHSGPPLVSSTPSRTCHGFRVCGPTQRKAATQSPRASSRQLPHTYMLSTTSLPSSYLTHPLEDKQKTKMTGRKESAP